MKHSYGDPDRELSYEYFNFYLPLQSMGHDVRLYDYMAEMQAVGRDEMNKRLVQQAQAWQPDIAIFSLYTNQFDVETIASLRRITKTFCFFHDDTWRVEYAQHWAKQFDYFSSPDFYAPVKYQKLGLSNCFYFPFGVNEQIFKKTHAPKKYDVSFVGGWHSYREWLINKIRSAGINVKVFGYGWSAGEVSQTQMVDIFNQTRINLNLSNSVSWDLRYLASSPRAILHRLRSKKNIEQMKARMFEVNGCGGFQLTYYVEGLAQCYAIDQELAVYVDADDLIEKLYFYLNQESQREAIAEAGYRRSIAGHTYAKRFECLFQKMGLTQ